MAGVFVLNFLYGCNGKFDKVPEERFVGTWELQGRKIYDGIQVQIKRENGTLKGYIVKLNDNKYVRFFLEENSLWIPEIKRSSDYAFKLKENKIGKELFSIYGLSGSEEYVVGFMDENTFGLGKEGSDPQKSSVFYKRIK
jgi:hypothetical protein